MARLPVADRHKEECGNCYGNGCGSCGHRGWHESAEGREEREDEEDRRADEWRHERRPVDGMDLDYGVPMDSPSWQRDD